MSTDEAAAVIGRMMFERKDLHQREVAISEELSRIGEGLGDLGRKLRGGIRAVTDTEIALLDASVVGELVSSYRGVKQRLEELDAALERAGL